MKNNNSYMSGNSNVSAYGNINMRDMNSNSQTQTNIYNNTANPYELFNNITAMNNNSRNGNNMEYEKRQGE